MPTQPAPAEDAPRTLHRSTGWRPGICPAKKETLLQTSEAVNVILGVSRVWRRAPPEVPFHLSFPVIQQVFLAFVLNSLSKDLLRRNLRG